MVEAFFLGGNVCYCQDSKPLRYILTVLSTLIRSTPSTSEEKWLAEARTLTSWWQNSRPRLGKKGPHLLREAPPLDAPQAQMHRGNRLELLTAEDHWQAFPLLGLHLFYTVHYLWVKMVFVFKKYPEVNHCLFIGLSQTVSTCVSIT